MEQAHMNLQLDELNTKYYIIISLDGRQVIEQAHMNLQSEELNTKYYIIISLDGCQMIEQAHMNIQLEELRRSHDRMVVGFTTTCAISAYHH